MYSYCTQKRYGKFRLAKKFPNPAAKMLSQQTIPEAMRGMVYETHGPDKLAWRGTMPVPQAGKNQILVKVEAGSLNPYDVYATESQTTFLRRKGHPVGSDVAGTVVARGQDVTRFRVGDKVFGLAPGCSQYTNGDVNKFERIPANGNPLDYGAIGFAGVTAHQILARHWFDRPEYAVRSLLVIGASGGVGSNLVQIARAVGGPEVTIYGVCSTKNCSFSKDMGATHCIDYTSAGFNISRILPAKSVDLIVDVVSGVPGNPNYVNQAMELLKPSGRYVALNSTSTLDWIRAYLTDTCGCNVQRSRYDLFSVNQKRPGRNLHALATLMEQQKLKPFISREVPLAETTLRRALHTLKQGHTRGKIRVITEQQATNV